MAQPRFTSESLTDEVIDFLLSKPSPEDVVALHPSTKSQDRLRALLDANRNDTISDSEKVELENYLRLEHLVRQLKIRAQERLTE